MGRRHKPVAEVETEVETESNAESNILRATESNTVGTRLPASNRPLLNSSKQEKLIVKLLDALSIAAADNRKKPRFDNETKHKPGPRNPRDRLIFQLLVLGVPASIIADRSLLAESSVYGLRQRWKDDGTLDRSIRARQEENDLLLDTFASKALLVLNDAMDDGDPNVRVAAAKAITVASSNAAARRQKEKTDTAYIDIGKEQNELFAKAIANHQTRQPPEWLSRRMGQLPSQSTPDTVDKALDVEYELVEVKRD